jgi:hypothetical protein
MTVGNWMGSFAWRGEIEVGRGSVTEAAAGRHLASHRKGINLLHGNVIVEIGPSLKNDRFSFVRGCFNQVRSSNRFEC